MNVTCDVIRDLLPVYHDDICSPDSRALVEGHLCGCENCRAELAAMDADIVIPHPAPEAEAMKKLNKAWKKVKRKSLVKGLMAAALVLALLIGGFFSVFSLCRMEGGRSMSPTIEHGDICLVNKLDQNYVRGGLVCVPYMGVSDMVRLVGLPGDTVSIEDGVVLVNGQVFYTESGDVDPMDMDGPVTVGWDQFFVMGDNHEHSLDSRDSRYGLISRKSILGKVVAVWKPLSLSPHEQVEAVAVEIE